MDTQLAFNIVVSLAAFFGSRVLDNIHKTLQRLDKDVRDMPVLYVTREDYRYELKEVKEALNKILDKLDNKVDK